MESVSILFTLKICYIFFTMFLRNKCIKDPCMCLLKNLIVNVSETHFRNITCVSWRNTNWENMWHFSMGNTKRYINRPTHHIDDHAMSDSHWDSLNGYVRDGHSEGHSCDKIQWLGLISKICNCILYVTGRLLLGRTWKRRIAWCRRERITACRWRSQTQHISMRLEMAELPWHCTCGAQCSMVWGLQRVVTTWT